MDVDVTFPKMWFQFANDTVSTESGTEEKISNLFYGFPAVPWGPPNMARIAVDAATCIIKDPSERSAVPISPADLENTRQFVAKHVKGVGPNVEPTFAGPCMQTNVFDNMFVLDYIPDDIMPGAGPGRSKSIAVYTAGWAMKFVPLIGTVIKQLLVDGGTKACDISQFKMTRTGPKGEHIIQHCGVGGLPKCPGPRSGSSLPA